MTITDSIFSKLVRRFRCVVAFRACVALVACLLSERASNDLKKINGETLGSTSACFALRYVIYKSVKR